MSKWFLACGFFLLLACRPLQAQTPAADEASLAKLAEVIKGYLLTHLPHVLHEQSHNWGKTSPALHAVHWKGKGLRVRPKVEKVAKNDGHWKKVRITTRNLPATLEFKLSNLRQVDGDKMVFSAYLAFQTTIEFDRQIWESGVRLFGATTRARLRLKLPMECEAAMRLEPGPSFLPDMVFRLRVLKADLSYDQLVVEHIAGIGGDGARLLGDTLHGLVKGIKPSLEKDLFNRANAAIVKAADTREFRLSLGSLWQSPKK